MATPQVNTALTAGASFSQSFNISNADGTPTDLSGNTFTARLAKRPGAYNAVTSTSTVPVFDYVSFTATSSVPTTGVIVISLTAAQTAALDEGKYVFSLVMDDGSGSITELIHGLVTVRTAIGFSTTLGV